MRPYARDERRNPEGRNHVRPLLGIPIPDVVKIGMGHDRRGFYWTFTPVGPLEALRVRGIMWRLFDSIPANEDLEARTDSSEPHVVARGSMAVRFADLLRTYCVKTRDEGDTDA